MSTFIEGSREALLFFLSMFPCHPIQAKPCILLVKILDKMQQYIYIYIYIYHVYMQCNVNIMAMQIILISHHLWTYRIRGSWVLYTLGIEHTAHNNNGRSNHSMVSLPKSIVPLILIDKNMSINMDNPSWTRSTCTVLR